MSIRALLVNIIVTINDFHRTLVFSQEHAILIINKLISFDTKFYRTNALGKIIKQHSTYEHLNMFKEPKIIFHHIPKCGGTSIVTGLAMTYYPIRLLLRGKGGFNARLNAPETAEYAKQNDINKFTHRRNVLRQHVESQTCPFVSGHYPFDYDLYSKSKEEWGFVTLLRDPLKRWYSEYYWNRYKDHAYRKTEMSVEEYVETPEGIENTRSFVNYFAMTENTDVAVTQAEKDEALSRLSCFTVIGFLEELEKFRVDMKHAFGRKPFFLQRNKSPAANVEKTMPDKDSDFEKNLLRLLEADIEIYKKAQENK